MRSLIFCGFRVFFTENDDYNQKVFINFLYFLIIHYPFYKLGKILNNANSYNLKILIKAKSLNFKILIIVQS